MANEFGHNSVGTELTQAEFESNSLHKGGTEGYILASVGGVPVWVARDIGARVYNNANISIPDATITTLTFNTERWDTDTIHEGVTNPARLTCKTAGKYIISANVRWAGNATGLRILYLYYNGTDEIGKEVRVNLTTDAISQTLTTIYELAVNDYVTIAVAQNSTGALDVTYTAKYSPDFMIQRVG